MTVERESYSDIREAVAKLCARFPGDYWRGLDREMIYPSEFVKELTPRTNTFAAPPGSPPLFST